jgi:hypothetical protein
MRIASPALAAAAVAALAAAAPAGAQSTTTTATVKVAPNRTNRAVLLTIDAAGGTSAAGIPQGVTVLTARGFGFDPNAVATRCDPAGAQQNSCPAESKIGTGTVDIQVDGPFAGAIGAGSYHGTSEIFLGAPMQAGDLASLIVRLTILGTTTVATGRVIPLATGPYGLQLAFDPLPQPPVQPPPGYTVNLQALHTDVAATRTMKKVRHKRVRRNGRLVRRRVVTRIRHDLVRTPKKCAGTWPVNVAVRYPARTDTIDTPIACRR